MATKFKQAPEIRSVAQDLIDEYPADLGHLRGERIEYIWRNVAATKKGQTVYGTASLITGRNALLALQGGLGSEDWAEGKDYAFFVIEMAKDVWENFSEKQRRAAVFHELLHCGSDDEGNLLLWPHDVEEFGRVPAEFGLWKADLERFAEAFGRNGQPPLPLDTHVPAEVQEELIGLLQRMVDEQFGQGYRVMIVAERSSANSQAKAA